MITRSSGGPAASMLCGVLSALFAVVSLAQTDTHGTTYESLARLPDFGGWWLASVARTAADELRSEPPPFKPNVLAERNAALGDDTPDPFRHCRPWQFTGWNGRFTEALEILFTPGRVTLTNERGLIRRIYMDQPMPADLEPTNTGTSVGWWEGETLVVETSGIDSRAPYPGPGPGAVAIGEGVVISERISLRDESTLQFDSVTTAPEIFSAPDRRTQLYTRLPKTMGNEISFCSEFDRSVDPATGRQRLDMTPPPDLPPPPPR